MPGFLLILFWIVLNSQVYQIHAECLNWQISKFNPNLPNDFNPNSNENPYLVNEVFTPRPGIHYLVVPKSKYPSRKPDKACPEDSSLTYIKSLEEWNDWKFIIGKLGPDHLSLKSTF